MIPLWCYFLTTLPLIVAAGCLKYRLDKERDRRG
jgi:hypothetical protein